MEKTKIDIFIGQHSSFFMPQDLMLIRSKLEEISDEQFYILQSIEFRDPTTILIIALLLGWERFWLDDAGLGVLKILTGYGCGIWWLIDVLSAKKRAQQYNYKKFAESLAIL